MRAVLKELVKKTEKPLPRVSNENVFSAAEYGAAVGLKGSAVRNRIRKMVDAGQVRRVRNAQGMQAFEWLGK